MKEKPPVLSDKEMDKVKFDMGSPWGCVDRYTVGKAIAEAQRDADVAHYEPIIEQAKVDVAREIFEEIEKILEPTFRKETPLPIPNFYIRETKLQSLKDKWLKKAEK